MVSLIADAVLPIAWILALGFAISRVSNLGEAFWRGLEWVSYWILMPSLLIEVIIRAPDISVPWGPLIGSSIPLGSSHCLQFLCGGLGCLG